jgi:hypothetical protein
MDRIQQANLKLAPKKCSFFKRKVKFVGHIVSAAGVEIDPDKTEKVTVHMEGYYQRILKLERM